MHIVSIFLFPVSIIKLEISSCTPLCNPDMRQLPNKHQNVYKPYDEKDFDLSLLKLKNKLGSL